MLTWKSFKDQRNTMTHEFSANFAVTQQLLDGAALIRTFERELDHACYAVEQLIILFDFINGAGDVTGLSLQPLILRMLLSPCWIEQ